MAWTQKDVDALGAAMAKGLKRAVFQSGDHRREHEFQSTEQMRALLAEMRADVAASAAGGAGFDPLARGSIAQHSRD